MDFPLGDEWVCGKRSKAGPATPRRAAFPGPPLVVLVLRCGLDVGIASGVLPRSDGIFRRVLAPLRRSPHLGDTVRGSGFAGVLESGGNGPHFGDEGDDRISVPHRGQVWRNAL